MERQRFGELCALLRQANRTHRSDPRCTYTDYVIAQVVLWAWLHDRSILWATQRANWPGDLRPRGGLPSQSQMSRRMCTPGVKRLFDAANLMQCATLPRGNTLLIDARPLPTGGCSKDPDAASGFGAGHKQRGYRLHVVAYQTGVIEQWRVTAMNVNEQIATLDMMAHLPANTRVIGDGAYDTNACFAAAANANVNWIATPRHRHAKALGHRVHHPDRITNWHTIRTPEYAAHVHAVRTTIERINAW